MSHDVATLQERLRAFLDVAHHHLQRAEPVLDPLRVVAERLAQLWESHVAPHMSEQAAKIAFAVVLLFMGGRFQTTIACVQIFHTSARHAMHSSWELAQAGLSKRPGGALNFAELRGMLTKALLAQSGEEKHMARRQLFLLVRCVDPAKTMDALGGFWTGILAVVSALRSRTVYTFSMGHSIGTMIYNTLRRHLDARIEDLAPEARQWLDIGFQSLCSVVGVGISLTLARLVNAFNSALQGATALTKVLFEHFREQKKATRHKRLSIGHIIFALPGAEESRRRSTTDEEEAVKWAIALIGFTWQVKNNFTLPLLFKAPLAPLYLLESVLESVALPTWG